MEHQNCLRVVACRLLQKEVKRDIKDSTKLTLNLISKAKDIITDEAVHKAIKDFILVVEEKNQLAKQQGQSVLSGEGKRKLVMLNLSRWVTNVTGSTEKSS